MKLPNCERAVVAREKIADYLLATGHPDGGPKAEFFLRFGFTADAWRVLAALTEHARAHDVTEVAQTPHGTVYCVEGPIDAPDGRRPRVRSVWIVRKGSEAPALVSAYPQRGGTA